jgi:hypothetical protein
LYEKAASKMLVRLTPCHDSETKPDEFDDGDDAHAEDETEETSDRGEVIDPRHPRLTANLENGGFLEEELNN